MKLFSKSSFVLALTLLFAMVSRGQISMRGTAPTLNVTTAVAGSEPTPDIDVGSSVRYSARVRIAKITVQTACPNQKFTLTVLATGVTRGVAAPEVTLLDGMPATDFITSIPTGWGGSAQPTLQYTARPTFSDGTGTDRHTVTYTILAQ